MDSVLCTLKSHTKTKIRRNKIFNKTRDGEVQHTQGNNNSKDRNKYRADNEGLTGGYNEGD